MDDTKTSKKLNNSSNDESKTKLLAVTKKERPQSIEERPLNEQFLDAAIVGDIGKMRECLANGAYINAVDAHSYGEEYTALHHASNAGNMRAKERPQSIEERPLNEQFLDAAIVGDIDKVREYLANGTYINAVDAHSYGEEYTALHHASNAGHTSAVEFLLAKKADPLKKNIEKQIPLHRAVFQGNFSTVKLLLKNKEIAKKSVNLADKEGNTPLHFAVLGIDIERTDIVQLLINKGADVNALDNQGKAPLHHSAMYGQTNIMSILLQNGAEVDALDNQGKTPLHYAVKYALEGKIDSAAVKPLIKYTILKSGEATKLYCITQSAELSEFWNDYQAEVEKMQSDDPLLCEFLLEIDEAKLAGYLNNPDMRKKLETGQYRDEYPLYADMIKSQHEKAIIQNQLDDPSVEQAQKSHELPR